MTRAELQQRMSAKEFTEWQIYYSIQPFGERRDDFRSGLICSVLANIHRDEKKRREPFPLDDFLLKFEIDDTPKVPTMADAERLHLAFTTFKAGYERSKENPS